MRGHHAQPPVDSPPAPPPPTLPPVQETKTKGDVTREDKLLSDLWAASAATFRRQGKIEQAKGAIQEAEVKNPDNPAVWVQVRCPPFSARVLLISPTSSDYTTMP